MKRYFAISTVGKSLKAHLKTELGVGGSLAALGVKSVAQFTRWKFPKKVTDFPTFLPQVVISFGGWKAGEYILNGVAVQGHQEWEINLLTQSGYTTPSGPDSVEMAEQIAELYVQSEQLEPPTGLWAPDANAAPGSLALEQYQKGIEIHSVFPKEIRPIAQIDLNEVLVDLQTIPLAVVGDSYKR